MLQEGGEVAPGWARWPPDGHGLSSWPSAAKEGKLRPGMGPDGANHVVCAQKLHRGFLLQNQSISSFLPWTFLSLTQGRKVSTGVVRGLSGFLSSRCHGRSPHLELRREPQVSSPVLTCFSGFLWSFHRGIWPHLMWRHASPLSSQPGKAV